MTWEFVGESDSAVEITLTPVDGGTELVLVHRDLTGSRDAYLAGWHSHLDVLAAVAEGDAPPPWRESGPGGDGALRAHGRHRRLVGPCRHDRHPSHRADPAGPPLDGRRHDAGVGRRRRPVASAQRDHPPGRRQVGDGSRPTGRLRRAQPGHPEFFIRKAIGWALREYAKVDPAWVRRFVDIHGDAMSGLSRREATKHLG